MGSTVDDRWGIQPQEIVEVCGDAITHARGSQGMTPALLMVCVCYNVIL